MKTITPTTRARLEMQGFVGMDDASLADIRPWLRLCCLVASIWIGAIGWTFSIGASNAGYILGCLFIAGALLPVLFDFCLPSYLYSILFGKPATCSAAKTETRVMKISQKPMLMETLWWKPLSG